MKFIKTLLLAAAVAFTGTAVAQSKLLLAAGDVKGGSTYAKMAQDFDKYCGNGGLTIVSTTGGVENRDLLLGNKVNMGMMQADMLEFTRRTDPTKVANIRTLFGLHNEEVHLVAYSGVKKEGGYLGGMIGAKSVSFNTMADLAGRTVGAVGGSFDSASVISNVSGVNFKVARYPNNAELKAALESGKLDVAVIVGGAQHALVASLSNSFRLIPMPKDLRDKLVASKLYAPAVLTYSNLGATGLETVATRALLVTRDYRGADMSSKLKTLRQCFSEKLVSLSEDIGNHEKWSTVNSEQAVSWPLYE